MTLLSHVRKEVCPIRKPQRCLSFTPSFLPFSLPNSHFCREGVLHDNKKYLKISWSRSCLELHPIRVNRKNVKTVESYEWGLSFMYTVFRLLLQIHKWIRDIHICYWALSKRFGKKKVVISGKASWFVITRDISCKFVAFSILLRTRRYTQRFLLSLFYSALSTPPYFLWYVLW